MVFEFLGTFFRLVPANREGAIEHGPLPKYFGPAARVADSHVTGYL